MSPTLIRLHPAPAAELPLHGTYLAHGLHRLGTTAIPLVYSNFVSSLDGRIAVADAAGDPGRVPGSLANPNDFRLFLELQAQADCLITHGGYLRAIAQGRLDDILQIGLQPGTADLAAWRRSQGLAPQPAVVVTSASLDFELPPSLARHGQAVYVATTRRADPGRLRELERAGARVLRPSGDDAVPGHALTRELGELGYRSLYLVAGPILLSAMLRERMLSRFFLTLRHTVLGGEHFHTLASGPSIGQGGGLALRALYLDAADDQGQQMFAEYRPLGAPVP